MTVDETLQNHDPDYGYILPSKRGFFAWQIMEMVARKKLKYGYWKKTENGYRLLGITETPPPPKPGPNWWLIALSLAAILGILALLLYRRYGRKSLGSSSSANSKKACEKIP